MNWRKIIFDTITLSIVVLATIGGWSAIASLTDFSIDPVGVFIYVTMLTVLLWMITGLAIACIIAVLQSVKWETTDE